ncbi:hypothetical protein RRG08_004163 [Elysia crispata]|uniref:Uncharacterized protein n=1 Tax=Elysia crispata TaxID=231223 RepID=A0AAE1D5S5_9GAST|nr:hypothetical protein RRG08_004163 [Elysia crispata]
MVLRIDTKLGPSVLLWSLALARRLSRFRTEGQSTAQPVSPERKDTGAKRSESAQLMGLAISGNHSVNEKHSMARCEEPAPGVVCCPFSLCCPYQSRRRDLVAIQWRRASSLTSLDPSPTRARLI